MSERLCVFRSPMPTKTFPAQFEYLDAIREFAAVTARHAGMDDKEVYNIQLAVDDGVKVEIALHYAVDAAISCRGFPDYLSPVF